MITKHTIREYLDPRGFNPFRHWLSTLTTQERARIQARLFRIEAGNLGDYKSVGHGVFELRFTFGAGYRVYFSFEKDKLIILLGGGSKSSQQRDITIARLYWLEYKGRGTHGTKKR